MILSECRRLQAFLDDNGFRLPSREDKRFDEYIACKSSVALLYRCQPPLLNGWTPVSVAGDGNCLFRAVSFVTFGTQELHKQLRLLACLEVGVHQSFYDSDNASCHPLLRRLDIVAPAFTDLFADIASVGTSCCVGALIALSSVLMLPISSYYPPLQATFTSPLTVDIAGRGVDPSAHGVAVMWSALEEIKSTGPVGINHVVPLLACAYVNTTAAEFVVSKSDSNIDVLDITASPERKRSRVDSAADDSALDVNDGPTLAFKDVNSLVTVLSSTMDVLPSLPKGLKNNVMFVTKLAVDPVSKRVSHCDDCGAWNKSTKTATQYISTDDRLVYVVKRGGVYCTGGRKGKWTPLSPQPDPQDVVTSHRYYATLKADVGYRKRVTWFSNLPCADGKCVWEYQGARLGENAPHGNSKHNARPYVRTRPETLQRIEKAAKHRNPRDVYESMIKDDSVDAPRDLHQVRQVKLKARRTKPASQTAAANIADDVLDVISMLDSHPFVRKVILGKTKQPLVALYTDDQVADLKRCCCRDGDGVVRSVLGVDRTFNLGPCYVTVVVFNNPSVVRNDTRTSPTFAGPMYLHWDGSYNTYVDMFTHLRSTIDSAVVNTELRLSASVVIGSDAERGLTKAIREVFHESTHLLCVKHLKDNVVDYMRNKCGVQQSRRNQIVDRLFGDGGLVNADDSVAFKERADALAADCESISAVLGQHFVRHVEPALRMFVFEPRQRNNWIRRRWTNNACESINHLLKLSIDWRPRRLQELVDCLYKVVVVHMSDLRRALYSHGNYTVTEPFKRFLVAHTAWQAKTSEEKDAHFAAFLAFKPRAKHPKTVTSANGVLTLPASPRIATKPGQRKRPHAERVKERR
jgi:hypothetical protein